MGKDLITSQHALHGTLDSVTEASSFQQWSQETRETPNVDRRRLTAVLEAAANDPIGLHVLARSVMRGETYEQSISHLPSVTRVTPSVNAMKLRISRLQRRILSSVSE
jgi:hypothetical protein